ncbi:rRNA methyltransferase 3A, mitochondrial [Syngnathus typhle]|uniref:rRNA methyltransferase 3A, mitochondrial n=1 Tax=Syngnathus typhle TaxID=161592 RepID=UPI002A6A989C|nr:rRNA methyltransferase 3A, mitochondrial [Syngnathus typhle]
MATYIGRMRCLFSLERAVFLSRGNIFSVETKRYVRGLRRKPVRVIFPENEKHKGDVKQAISAGKKEAKVPLRAEQHPGDRGDLKTRNSQISSATVKSNETDEVPFERALPGDKRLARLVSVARSRTFREQQGKVLLEGRRLICDALNAGAVPQTIFFSTLERLRELPLDKLRRAALVKVKFEDIKLWSDLVAPQGVIGIFSRPDASRLRFEASKHSVPLSLICNNIRDPGNLGTMLRCAAAAGCHQVLLTKGCVDIWEPKVLRAAMGAHFHLPIHPSLTWEEVEDHLPEHVGVYVADTQKSLEVNSSHKPSDFGWISTTRAHRDSHLEESDSDEEELSLPKVDAAAYHNDWARSPVALVVGGETYGISVEALQLAEKKAGCRLFVPMVPHVDSLNSAMAASILLFEGRKQLLNSTQNSGKKRRNNAGQRLS